MNRSDVVVEPGPTYSWLDYRKPYNDIGAHSLKKADATDKDDQEEGSMLYGVWYLTGPSSFVHLCAKYVLPWWRKFR